MADIKVSELPEASQINDEDLLMIVQGGTNKKITKSNAQFASGDEVAISTEEPTEGEKIWINPEDTPSGSGSPVTNNYSISTEKAYSCNYMEQQFIDIDNKIENTCSYSTTEYETGGTWIDGKKIYRKSVNVTSTLTANTENRVAYLYNVDSIIDLRGTGVLASNYFIQFPYVDDTNNMTLYIRKLTNDYAITLVPKSTAITNINIIVEYTKTTD